MIPNLTSTYKERIQIKILEFLKLEPSNAKLFKFETPPEDKMGHLAFACFPLAKLLKKSPPFIARILQKEFIEDPMFAKVEAIGPYLNFFFDSNTLYTFLLESVVDGTSYGKNEIGRGKRLMLEFSSPNSNKPLHLGHGRNNLLGMTLSSLFEHCGYEVVKVNLINDRGIHICKSMFAYQTWGKQKTPEMNQVKGDRFVGGYYVRFGKEAKKNPEMQESAISMLRKWETGNQEVRKLWQLMKDWVMQGFYRTYERMGIAFDRYYYESETYEGGREIVLNFQKKGVCQLEENGSISIDLESKRLGKKILLRGDGTTVYMTQDINTTLRKFQDYELDHCLFVVGNEQDNHFRTLFAVLEKLGFEWAKLCEHISYGMINLPEGKMKTREGTVVDLDDLMEDLKNLALEELKSREVQKTTDRSLKEVNHVAEAIGQAALKYYILKTNAGKTITFNPKESLAFEGATGPYLQYTHARITTLLKKAGTFGKLPSSNKLKWNNEEIKIMVRLIRFPDVILESANQRNPSLLCTYLFDLSKAFNKFYYEHKILKLKSELEKSQKLTLVFFTRQILSQALRIIGIEPLDQM